MDVTKYYSKCTKQQYLEVKNGIESKNEYFKKINIPLATILRKDDSYVELFYTLLFIHKGLKKYRNTVSHANAEESEKITKDNLKKWIELYIEILDKLMRDAKVLLKK